MSGDEQLTPCYTPGCGRMLHRVYPDSPAGRRGHFHWEHVGGDSRCFPADPEARAIGHARENPYTDYRRWEGVPRLTGGTRVRLAFAGTLPGIPSTPGTVASAPHADGQVFVTWDAELPGLGDACWIGAHELMVIDDNEETR